MPTAIDISYPEHKNARLRRNVRLLKVLAVAALIMTMAIAGLLYPLIKQRAALKREIETLKAEKIQQEQDKERLNKEINDLKDTQKRFKSLTDSLNGITGKRKIAVSLALQLQKEGVKYVESGRSRATGFDMSGFIAYILSQEGIEIIKSEDVPFTNISRLMSYPGITITPMYNELQPGDLIFYPEWNTTMMFLTDDLCIGMMWRGTVEIKDVSFGPTNRKYGKVAYGD